MDANLEEWLVGSLEVSSSTGSGVIGVTTTSGKPVASATINSGQMKNVLIEHNTIRDGQDLKFAVSGTRVSLKFYLWGWTTWKTGDELADEQAEADADFTQSEFDDFIADSPEQFQSTPDEDPTCTTLPDGTVDCIEPWPTEPDGSSASSEGATSASSLAVPDRCEAPYSSTRGWFMASRFFACRVSEWKLNAYYPGPPLTRTQHTVAVVQDVTLAPRADGVIVSTKFVHLDGAPFLSALPGISWSLTCSAPLSCPDDSGSTGRLQEGEESGWFTRTANSTLDFNERASVTDGWDLRFRITADGDTGVFPMNPQRLSIEQVRCDRVDYMKVGRDTNTRGCVLPRYAPVFNLYRWGKTQEEREEMRPVLVHMRDALDAGYAGSLVLGNPVTRRMGKQHVDANRKRALRKCNTPPMPSRPEGHECDEYPFATTDQGCASPTDCSVRWVPWRANRKQGGYKGAFEKAARVLNGDDYYVVARIP